VLVTSKEAAQTIMYSETIFGDLKKLTERPPTKQNENTMDIPKSLGQINSTHLVMPIEENLSPQLPPLNYKKNFIQKALVRTSLPITSYDESNAFAGHGNASNGAGD